MSNDDINGELREINEKLGWVRGTLEGIDGRLDTLDPLFDRVKSLEVKASRSVGYAAGVAAAIAVFITLAGFIVL